MPTSLSSISIASPVQPRKRTRTLPQMALALATLAAAGLFNPAHATFPGENGVIVFHSLNPITENFDIQRVSPGNSAVTTLATAGRSPSVSPNGRKVAFSSQDGLSIYVMNIDGSNVVLLDSGQPVDSPVWLPDGSQVVFARTPPNNPIELWTVNPDGSGKAFMRSLKGFTSSGRVALAWSPLGNLYAFDSGGLNIADNVTFDVRKLAPEGSGAAWAPDGASILFRSNNGGQFEINPDGSNLRQVPSTGYVGFVNAISPDGALIAGGMSTNGQSLLTTRKRAGSPTTFSWAANALNTDWSRVPKNCYATTSQGGGGVLAGDVDFYAAQCAIAVMPDSGQHGALQQAIAIGPDQRLYHRVLKPGAPGVAPTWTSFTRVPGAGGNSNGINARKIAIAASRDGSAQVVIINTDDNLVYHAMRYANGTWSGFVAVDGASGAPNFAARDVAIAIDLSTPTSPGNAQVIANGLAAGGLYHRVRWPAGNWSSFQPISDSNVFTTNGIALAVGEDGNTNVLAITTTANGNQSQIMQSLRYAAGNWSGWGLVAMPAGITFSTSSDVAVTRTINGLAQVMFTDSMGNAYSQDRPTPNMPFSWQVQAPTTQIANTVGRAVSISAGATAGSSSQLLLTRTFPQ